VPDRSSRTRPTDGPNWEPLARDRTHGAYPLAIAAVRALHVAARGSQWFESLRLRTWARQLEHAQPAIGSVRWLAEQLRRRAILRKRMIHSSELRTWVRDWQRQLKDEQRELLTAGLRRFPLHATVVTFSYSTVVLRLLCALRGERRPRRVVVLHSRPGGEGRRLAVDLRAHRVPARGIRDDRVGPFLRHADLVLLGADSVYSDGSLLHKVGTRRLAVSARQAGVPVVVLAGRSKWLAHRAPRRVPGPGWFDRTPRSLISEYWTGERPPRTRRPKTPFSSRSRRTPPGPAARANDPGQVRALRAGAVRSGPSRASRASAAPSLGPPGTSPRPVSPGR
jgi:translation initiation factor 2B subunit (eIF-2B alpha/beta/delta family)